VAFAQINCAEEEETMIPAAQALIAELEQEAQSTRRVLERVPADRLGWKPHPKSMSAGQLAVHVARLPGDITRLAKLDSLDAATVDFRPPQPESTAELLPALEAGVAEAKAFLAGLDDAAAAAPWRLTMGERELWTLPRLALLRTLLFNHWYHHRGQLVVYLRLLDVPVPSVYGPSADENPFAAAAA
jgi:uncharacterized damage-inducible protein DinB